MAGSSAMSDSAGLDVAGSVETDGFGRDRSGGVQLRQHAGGASLHRLLNFWSQMLAAQLAVCPEARADAQTQPVGERRHVDYPRIHNHGVLIELRSDAGVKLPADLADIDRLTPSRRCGRLGTSLVAAGRCYGLSGAAFGQVVELTRTGNLLVDNTEEDLDVGRGYLDE